MLGIPQELFIFATYLRLVAFVIIIFTSLLQYKLNGKLSKLILLGDCFVAVGYFLSTLHIGIFGKEETWFVFFINTPVVILWSVIHFVTFLQSVKVHNKDEEKVCRKA